MTEHPPAEVLRHQLVTFRKNNRFAPYPSPIRRQAIQYANARTIQGATPSTIAAELGVATTTVSLWTHSTRSKSADAPAQTSPSELPLVRNRFADRVMDNPALCVILTGPNRKGALDDRAPSRRSPAPSTRNLS